MHNDDRDTEIEDIHNDTVTGVQKQKGIYNDAMTGMQKHGGRDRDEEAEMQIQ
jgi:hypothetical protein